MNESVDLFVARDIGAHETRLAPLPPDRLGNGLAAVVASTARHDGRPLFGEEVCGGLAGPRRSARDEEALYTGLRPGELRALLWADVDLEARTISVSKALQRRAAPRGARPLALRALRHREPAVRAVALGRVERILRGQTYVRPPDLPRLESVARDVAGELPPGLQGQIAVLLQAARQMR